MVLFLGRPSRSLNGLARVRMRARVVRQLRMCYVLQGDADHAKEYKTGLSVPTAQAYDYERVDHIASEVKCAVLEEATLVQR